MRLCPWCDEPMPPPPFTERLTALINEAKRHSIPHPRPENPVGLKAKCQWYAEVCARHLFELKQVPEAHMAGWDVPIDWTALEARVQVLKPVLEEILLDEENIGARANLPFWKTVSKQGSTMEHLSNFKHFQVG